jgi:hypothetical protein
MNKPGVVRISLRCGEFLLAVLDNYMSRLAWDIAGDPLCREQNKKLQAEAEQYRHELLTGDDGTIPEPPTEGSRAGIIATPGEATAVLVALCVATLVAAAALFWISDIWQAVKECEAQTKTTCVIVVAPEVKRHGQ